MRAMRFTTALAATSLLTMAASQSIFQIADIPFYSSLAPCAMSAVSYAVNYLTNSKCPEGTAFQSCACTKQGNSAGVQVTITSSVKYSCGATATEDFSSASLVFNQYCNQASGLSTPGAGNTQVSHAITDIPYFADLAPCAASAVKYAVGTMTNYLCQEGVPQLHSCVCTKNENSFAVSSMIQSNVQYSCGATHSADITSALALFAGWCKMADGTTEFPTTSDLGGTMSYYINDLPDFSSMAKCAQSAVSYGVFTMTGDLCPDYPGALASCVCAKDGNSGLVSSLITSNVKYSCDNTATEDVTSALAIFDQYCRAAKGEVKPAGITASIPEKTSTAGGSSGAAPFPSPTATPKSNQPPRTSEPASTSTAADGSIVILPPQDLPDTTTHIINKGAMAGMIVGIVAGIAILGTAIWFFWRRHKRTKAAAAYTGAALASSNEEEKASGAGGAGAAGAGFYKGPNANTSELHNEEAAAAISARSTPRPAGSELAGSPKPTLPARKPVGGGSPVYGSELGGSLRPMGSELAGNGYAAQGNELHRSGYVAEGNELHGSGYAAPGNELPGSGYGGHPSNVHEAPGYGHVQHPQQQQQAYGYESQGYGGQPMYGNNQGQVYEMPEHGGWNQNAPHR